MMILGYVFFCVFLNPRNMSAIIASRPIMIPYSPKYFERSAQRIAVTNAPKKNIEIFERIVVDLLRSVVIVIFIGKFERLSRKVFYRVFEYLQTFA